MTKKENNNLKHQLYRLAGKIQKLEKEGEERAAKELFRACNAIAGSINLDFTEIQIEYQRS